MDYEHLQIERNLYITLVNLWMPTSTYIYFSPCTCPTKSGASHDILLNMTSQVKTVNNPRQTHDHKTVNNHCNAAGENALLSSKHDGENMEKTQGLKRPHFPENTAIAALIGAAYHNCAVGQDACRGVVHSGNAARSEDKETGA